MNSSIELVKFSSPQEAYNTLIKRKNELEKRMNEIIMLRKQNKLSESEFNREKRKIEREFIEVMDRIMQLKFILNK
ncbi:MAG TPA: hypothetical protein ENG40_04485 [Thermoprotei archaeon]|nr:hypothetical protein [Thermoprotei archaeon]